MRSKGNNVSTIVREFEEKVRSLGSCISGATSNVQIHHVLGETAKSNKVHIGQYWILPLTAEEHELIGRSKKEFAEYYFSFSFAWTADLEKLLYHMMMQEYEDMYGTFHVPSNVVREIFAYGSTPKKIVSHCK